MTTTVQTTESSEVQLALTALFEHVLTHLTHRAAEQGTLADLPTVRCEIARLRCELDQLLMLTDPLPSAWRCYIDLIHLGGAVYLEHSEVTDRCLAALADLRSNSATNER